MSDLNDLYYFAQVIDHGGFAAASRAIGEPKSKLSRRVAALEERLATRLVQRSTRSLALTEIGDAFYRHCKAMLVEAESAEELIERSRAEPCGTVRISCPVALLETRVGDMISRFMLAHERVTVHLEATDRPIDPVAEGIDVAIRVRPPPLADSELVMRWLSDRGQSIVASPELLAHHRTPATPGDLASFPTMAIGRAQRRHSWHLVGPGGAEAEVDHRPRYVTHNMSALRAAATRGVGLVQFPDMMIREDLDRGRLVRALPDWAPPREVIHAVFPSRRGLLPSVRALLDHLAAEFRAISED